MAGHLGNDGGAWDPARRRQVDGGRFVRSAVRFARALRAAGLSADPGAGIDFARALAVINIGDREQVRSAGAAVFVRRRDDLETYDEVFDRFWRSRGVPLSNPPDDAAAADGSAPDGPPSEMTDEADDGPEGPTDGGPAPVGLEGSDAQASEDADDDADEAADGAMARERAWSAGQVDRQRQFDRMTAAELHDAERFIDILAPRLEMRRTRRSELHHHGRIVAPRAMFRRSWATGGEVIDWVWRRRTRRPRALVVICDISGSMERHARVLLRFSQALAASSVRTEAFVFGTRLTHVTRLLRDRDRDRALTRVAESVSDWSGGTRIGDSLRTFNREWARRALRSSAVVVIVSDGWDRGDPALVADEMARLQRSCHRLIWLNPLASTAGYQPLAGGMAAALPFIDEFVPAGTLASLERLALLLSDAPTRREAARREAGRPNRPDGPHAGARASQTSRRPAGGPITAIDEPGRLPTAARPLEPGRM